MIPLNKLKLQILSQFGITEDRFNNPKENDIKANAARRVFAYIAYFKLKASDKQISEYVNVKKNAYRLQTVYKPSDLNIAALPELEDMLAQHLNAHKITQEDFRNFTSAPKIRGRRNMPRHLKPMLADFIADACGAGYSYRQVAELTGQDHKSVQYVFKQGYKL